MCLMETQCTHQRLLPTRKTLTSPYPHTHASYRYTYTDTCAYMYRGNIISVESMDDPNPVDPTPISIANTTSNITYDNNSTEDNPDDEEDVPFVETPEITLRSTGSQILLYFYSDVAKQGPGFEISYWYI